MTKLVPRRLLLCLCLLVVLTGITQVVLRVTGRVPELPPRSKPLSWRVRLAASYANLLAPRRPPHQPPPGRPFSKQPVTYSGRIPSSAALHAAAKDANVVIIVLDAARVDHFGAYGYPRDATPNFDRLAKDSVLFDQHFCMQPETGPSTLSLLTGQYPDTHGLTTNRTSGPPSPPTFTLESAFARAGYATFLLSSSPVVSPEHGIPSDFEYASFPQRRGERLPDDPIAFLREDLRRIAPRLKGPRPFFAYLHAFPPHMPYLAPRKLVDLFREQRPPRYWQGRGADRKVWDKRDPQEPPSLAEWVNVYDANLRWADSFVGEVEAALRQAGALEHTLLIVTADHGEAMREHGYALHDRCPYDEALHIPLLVRFPGKRPPVGRVHALTQTIDLVATVLDLAGIPYPPDRVQGTSLAPLLTGTVRAAHHTVVSLTTGRVRTYTLRDSESTLLLSLGGKTRALYDMDRDPWQTRNTYRKQHARAAALEQEFDRFVRSQRYAPRNFLDPKAKPQTAPGGKLTEEQKRALRSLGYL